jgi:hypothetical protein
LVTPPSVAEIVTVTGAVTTFVVIGKYARYDPFVNVTDAGTVKAAGLLLASITLPAAAAELKDAKLVVTVLTPDTVAAPGYTADITAGVMTTVFDWLEPGILAVIDTL